MFQQFQILDVETNLKNKQVIIETNRDLKTNKENVVLELFNIKEKTDVNFDYTIEGKSIVLTLKDYPIPNTVYQVTGKNIKSVIDEELNSSLKKRFKFKSDIKSKIKIVSPSMHERVNSLLLKIEEVFENEDNKVNSYYVEISKDNSFIELVDKANFYKQEIEFVLKEPGQYFIRVRAEKNDMYGEFSETISFIYKNEINPIPDLPIKDDYVPQVIDDDLPIVDIDNFQILSYPEQGETPNKLIIEFNHEIDDLSLDDIIITRKVVK